MKRFESDRRVSRIWAALILGTFLVAGLLTRAQAQASPESCVACHTDAVKLKALTPSDPPVAEAGEG